MRVQLWLERGGDGPAGRGFRNGSGPEAALTTHSFAVIFSRLRSRPRTV
jgi:hypothetical protein